MKYIEVELTPFYKNEHINEVEVSVILSGMENLQPLFSLNKNTVGKEFLPFTKPLRIIQNQKELSFRVETKQEDHIEKEHYYLMNETSGEIIVKYGVALLPVGKNPVFDLGYEEQGMNGSGMTFLPFFPQGEYQYKLHWNLSKLPEKSIGVWSFGEGDVTVVGDENTLTESLYCAGVHKKVTRENCGFYWTLNKRLPGKEVSEFVLDLYLKMADFFRDEEKTYQIFSRKLPEALTGRNKMGGTALKNSFAYVYSMENPPSVAELKFLFPHEIVHNWLKLKDEPFGTCTWYVEGTAEFYSIVLMDRFGLITKEELIHQLNKRAKDYYENPRNEIPNEEAGRLLFKDGEATLVPYGRGFFYLLHVEAQIKKATNGLHSLDEVVLNILEKTRAGEECGNDTWLEEVKKVSGLDISKEFHEMQKGKIFYPQMEAFTTPLKVESIIGHKRETKEQCELFQFS